MNVFEIFKALDKNVQPEQPLLEGFFLTYTDLSGEKPEIESKFIVSGLSWVPHSAVEGLLREFGASKLVVIARAPAWDSKSH